MTKRKRHSAHFKYTVLEYVRENAGKESIPTMAKHFEMSPQTLYNWIYHNEAILDLLNDTGKHHLNKYLYCEKRIMKISNKEEHNG